MKFNMSCSNMQLTESVQFQSSNGIQQNNEVNGKDSKSNFCENSSTCPKESVNYDKNGVKDKEIEQDNGTDGIFNDDVSIKDSKIVHAINGTQHKMEINNGTNSLQTATHINGYAEKDVLETEVTKAIDDTGSAKDQCDTDTIQVSTDTNYSIVEKESEIILPSELQACANVTSTSQESTLENPGAVCVNSSNSVKDESEFRSLLEAQQVYMVYEFDIPQELCGLLIGRKGRHINYIKQESNVNIFIKKHPYFAHKNVCSVTGTEDEIYAALKLIRKHFPAEIYPTVTLSQVNNSLPFELQLPETCKLNLPEGIPFSAMLCATMNAGHFFLQQHTHPSYQSLPALSAQMKLSEFEMPRLESLSAGYVCAARLNDGYFRAEIVEVIEGSDECRLKFLDYGGCANVPKENIRQIKFEFLNLPFQASECHLANVTFPEGQTDWSFEANAVFEQLAFAQGPIVQGYIVGYAENVPCVLLYKVMGSNSVFINGELVLRGFARWNTAVF